MKKLFTAFVLALPVCAVGQVTVNASLLEESGAPANGVIYWAPVLAAGQAASYRKPGGGSVAITPKQAIVTNGAFSLTLPDTYLASPTNLCFRATLVTNNGSVLGPGYTCVQPGTNPAQAYWCTTVSSVTTCNFDNYDPAVAPLAVQVAGPNRVDSNTASPLTGILKANGSTVGVAISGTDYDGGGAAAAAQGASLQKSANLSDVANPSMALANLTGVPAARTVNGHALSGNVIISASDLTTGALPHAQMPALVSGDIPANGANTSGTAGGLSANIAESQVTNLVTDLAAKALQATTVNGHALSSNVTVSASDLTTGTLPHAQLPTLVSGDIPANGANTSGTAGGLSANIAESQVTNLVTDLAAKALQATTVNGHALSSNVMVSASDLSTGTLPHAQLPALVSGDIPANAANTSGTAGNVSGTPTLPNGTTATTQAAGDNSTKLATTAYVNLQTQAPLWLQYLGTGADGANTNASGNLQGVYYYTNFTVPFGNTVNLGSISGLTIHATGTCTVAGTIIGSGNDGTPRYAGSSGGSGGGAAGGAAGTAVLSLTGVNINGGGSAGGTSGGNGGNGVPLSSAGFAHADRVAADAGFEDGLFLGGAVGKQGGSSGGAGGNGGLGLTLICATITGTDGSHIGQINMGGAAGAPAAANSAGAGSGGGGGVVVLSSQNTIATQPTISITGGPGGLVTVPEAVSVGGTCTSPAKATLGVTTGALNGTCTVVQAGAGCGTGTGITFSVLGGGGTLGTGTVSPTWSGGALASCTTTAGTSSGYTASTFTTSGTGGDGGLGWSAVFQGW